MWPASLLDMYVKGNRFYWRGTKSGLSVREVGESLGAEGTKYGSFALNNDLAGWPPG